ncbi:MAG TPA: hypothetical protein VJN94_14655, partial [Candidatus Binataceae bacterium]|nr:hypothetical protein [Candidatus Binataceae bacterium]
MIESARPAFPPARRFSEWLEWLVALFSEELAANPRRVATTLRLALIATIGTGLMAVCHVSGGLGPYLLWLLLGPVAMMSPRAALADLMLVGALLAASFPIAGALSETPWLVLAVIGAFTAAATYVVAVRKLGAIGLLGQVVTLNGFYGVIFEPRDFGWQVSSLFGATAIALALITLFDNWIWPDPAEAVLLESIS